MENKAASPRWSKMVEMYGSEEAAKAEMKRRGSMSMGNRAGKGGFADIQKANPILHIQLSRKGGKVGKKAQDDSQA